MVVNRFQSSIFFPRGNVTGEFLESSHHSRKAAPAELPQCPPLRREHERVPQASGQQEAVGFLRAGFFPKTRDRLDRVSLDLPHRITGLNPAVLRLRMVRAGAQKHEPVGQLLRGSNRPAHGGEEFDLWMHEMVRGQDHDGCFRVLRADVSQRQKNTRRRVAVLRLGNDGLRVVVSETIPGVRLMVSGHNHQHAIGTCKSFRPVQGVAQHRAVTHEGAVLFGSVLAPPTFHQWPQPFSFTSGQDHRPDGRIHSG